MSVEKGIIKSLRDRLKTRSGHKRRGSGWRSAGGQGMGLAGTQWVHDAGESIDPNPKAQQPSACGIDKISF